MSPSTVFNSRCPKQLRTKPIQLSTHPMYSPGLGNFVITFHTCNVHKTYHLPTLPGIKSVLSIYVGHSKMVVVPKNYKESVKNH